MVSTDNVNGLCRCCERVIMGVPISENRNRFCSRICYDLYHGLQKIHPDYSWRREDEAGS